MTQGKLGLVKLHDDPPGYWRSIGRLLFVPFQFLETVREIIHFVLELLRDGLLRVVGSLSAAPAASSAVDQPGLTSKWNEVENNAIVVFLTELIAPSSFSPTERLNVAEFGPIFRGSVCQLSESAELLGK